VAYYGTVDAPGALFRVVDIETGTVTAEVPVGGHPEQVALDASGTIGLVGSDDDNVIRVFQTSDPLTTISMPLFTGGDPGGSAFFDATHALVANSVGLSVAVVNVTNPAMLTVDSSLPLEGAPYGVTPVPGTQTMLVTTMLSSAAVVLVDVATTPPTIAQEIPLDGGTFPLYAAVDPTGKWAFVAHPYDHVLSVVDLPGRLSRGVSWLSEAGPSYVAVQP
jgi:DNA-binding beta-propeller fold protein YncE